MKVAIDFGPPCRRPLDGAAVVVIDVIRATTTAITAAAAGRRCFPAPSLEAALSLASRLAHPLLVGEVRGKMPQGFDLTNSPSRIARQGELHRPMVLLSSSGTPLLDEVKRASAIFLACFRNWRATAKQLRHPRVVVMGAATHGELREEDRLCAAYLAAALVEAGYHVEDRQTGEQIDRWAGAPPEACLRSRSVEFLRRTGQLEDLDFILRHIDDLPAAFVLRGAEVVQLGG